MILLQPIAVGSVAFGRALDLRARVLGADVAQGRAMAVESDTHLCAFVGRELVGCVILKRADADGAARVIQLAVEPGMQKHGIGSALMQGVEAMADKANVAQLWLKARLSVVGFYEKLGYTPVDIVAEHGGAPHRTMGRILRPALGRVAHG